MHSRQVSGEPHASSQARLFLLLLRDVHEGWLPHAYFPVDFYPRRLGLTHHTGLVGGKNGHPEMSRGWKSPM